MFKKTNKKRGKHCWMSEDTGVSNQNVKQYKQLKIEISESKKTLNSSSI